MKPNICVIILSILIGLLSCKGVDKRLNIYMENSSDLKSEITIETYINKKIIDKIVIKRGRDVIAWEHFFIEFSEIKDRNVIEFKVLGSEYKTTCSFSRNQITKKTWMHVNLNETVFKKGYVIPGKVLNKDSLMEANFYCELVDQPR